MREIFSAKIRACLERVDMSSVCEVRLRTGGRAVVLTRAGRFFLSPQGLVGRREAGVVCERRDLEEVMANVTNRSLYSVNENVRQGFVTYRGCRVGLCGEIVREGERILTVKNISSVDVRVAHDVSCAKPVLPLLVEPGGRLRHTLVFSPPGCGKTTLIRDIAKNLAYADRPSNIVVVDERSEIGAFGLAECDVLSNLPKSEGLHFAVRNLNPDAVVCDEIKSEADVGAVFEAASCGVSVLATIHAATVGELRRKPYLARFFSEGVFERYVRLSARGGLGRVEEVLDEQCRPIFEEVSDEVVFSHRDRGAVRPPRTGDRGLLSSAAGVL